MDRNIAKIFDFFEWLAQQTDYISAAITQQLYMTPWLYKCADQLNVCPI